ncbi:MAG: pseudouridine synthase [Lachnospiraceae bacterium]|nr:pseudouridine synthase [Lachnospiraceae bacterium]
MQKVKLDNTEGIRLNKYLSDAGFCSRREADRLIEAGSVTIDEKKAVVGDRVFEGQRVAVKGKQIAPEEEMILLAFHKPVGIECTTDRKNPDNIVDFIGYHKRIYPIGRLDKNSHGLILMTNDGSIVNHILKASTYHEKEYIVAVNKKITDDFIKKMSAGVYLTELKQKTRPCKVEQLGDCTFRITLTQGLNRQIRRMCQELDYRVVDLKRIRIMSVELGKLKEGTYRNVRKDEIDKLLGRK